MNARPSCSFPGPTSITPAPGIPPPHPVHLVPPLPSGSRKDLTCSHWGLEGHGDCPLRRVPPGTYIFPAQCGFAALAENISYRVQPREQEALFSWPATHVDPVSGNRKDPAPSGVALSVQPPGSPKGTSIWRELSPPNGKPLPSAVQPFRTRAWALFLQCGESSSAQTPHKRTAD